MIRGVVERLAEEALTTAPGPAPPYRLLRFSQNNLAAGQILYFVFVKGRQLPSVVLRLPRDNGGMEALSREIGVYEEIRQRAAPLGGLPSRCLVEAGGATAIAEQFLEGRALNHLGAGETEMHQALSWLGEFQARTCQGAWRGGELREEVHGWVERYSASYPLSAAHRRSLELLLEAALRGNPRPLPVVAEHGDFNGYNVLIGRAGVQAVDWEWCRLSSQPLYDPLFFVVADVMLYPPLLRLAPARLLAGFQSAFLSATQRTHRASRLLARYLKVSRHPTDWLPISMACVLMSRACRDAALGKTGPDQGSVYRLFLESFLDAGGRSSVFQECGQRG